jgi:LacI family transcriptional regulator
LAQQWPTEECRVPATIKDVARAAGVHMSTVSRTFSAPHLVSPETRGRIVAVAESLGYRPNPAARALITGRTHNIGLIVADIANPFFPPLIKAAESQARERGYNVFVADTDEDAAVEEQLVRALARQVDGILLCSPRMGNGLIERLGLEVPLVVVNRPVSGLPAVLMDVARGARLAVEHLAQLGHREIALLAGPRGSWASREIRRSAVATARLAGASLTVLGPNPPTQAAGVKAAEQVWRAGVSAVVTFNDLLAIGLLEGLEAVGVRVPDDLSVIGMDDIPQSSVTRPRLTTISTPTPAAGRTAVDMLLQVGGQQSAAQVTLQTELIVRGSTSPWPGSEGRAPARPAAVPASS